MSGERSDRGDRQFIDTNILVYAHDTSAAEKHNIAKTLVSEMWRSGRGCLSVQVLEEFYVTVTRKVRKPLSPENASRIIARPFFLACTCAGCN